MKPVDHFLQIKYANLLGSQLERFKPVGKDTFNFRCPYCGDSARSSKKTRGYIYSKSQKLNFMCHNCGASSSFSKFLKEQNETLFKEMLFESLRGDRAVVSSTRNEVDESVFKTTLPTFKKNPFSKSFVPVTDLKDDHKALQYLRSRLIPEEHLNKILYTPNFKKSSELFFQNLDLEIPETFEIVENEMVVFPFSKEGIITHLQGRSLKEKTSFRYQTVTVLEDSVKWFEKEPLSTEDDIFVVEGPIDSLFLKNCGATADADLTRASNIYNMKNLILVPDNEPRNREIVKRIEKMFERGFRVVLFPHTIKEKDINDMVKAGIDVDAVIRENVYQGLTGKAKFEKWRRV